VDERGPLDAFRVNPASSVIVVDFDGTLSPIVDDPASAVPYGDVVEVLRQLEKSYQSVAVVSGRPLEFLMSHLPESLDMVGLYGLEGSNGGRRWEHPNGGVWREVMADVAMLSECNGPPGMRVELKNLSITFHYRGQPEIASQVEAYAVAQAERAGLRTRLARMSVELNPPIDTDKGKIVRRLATDADAVLFAGDDLGDLSAFDALDALSSEGVHAVKVAVTSLEAPLDLVSRADLVVHDPSQVRDVLASLIPD
jgi:trehalose 6-phosphate phosphatase